MATTYEVVMTGKRAALRVQAPGEEPVEGTWRCRRRVPPNRPTDSLLCVCDSRSAVRAGSCVYLASPDGLPYVAFVTAVLNEGPTGTLRVRWFNRQNDMPPEFAQLRAAHTIYVRVYGPCTAPRASAARTVPRRRRRGRRGRSRAFAACVRVTCGGPHGFSARA